MNALLKQGSGVSPRLRWIPETRFMNMQKEWNALVAKSVYPSIFLRHEWINTWWTVWGAGKTLRILILEDQGGKLKIIAPLYQDTHRSAFQIPMKVLKLLGTDQIGPDHMGFIVDAVDAEVWVDQCLDFLFKDSEWDLFNFSDLNPNNPLFTYFTDDRRHLIGPMIVDRMPCPYLPLPKSVEEYWAGLKSKRRNFLKRIRSTMAKNHSISMIQPKDEQEIETILIALYKLHEKRAEDKNRSSAFDLHKVREFHQLVATAFFQSGLLRLYALQLDGHIEGVFYGFSSDNRFYYYQSGFNPDFNHLRLGSALLLYAIESAITEGCHTFDFLKGGEEYKSRWTQHSQETVEITLFASRFISLIHYHKTRTRRYLGHWKRSLFKQ